MAASWRAFQRQEAAGLQVFQKKQSVRMPIPNAIALLVIEKNIDMKDFIGASPQTPPGRAQPFLDHPSLSMVQETTHLEMDLV